MNSESRHFSEQPTESTESLEANREHDFEFAEIVAIFLNEMIRRRVLTQEAVQNASPSAFEELMVRYPGVVGAGGRYFLRDEEKKLKTLFPSPPIEKGKREREVAELIIVMRNFF